MNPHTTLALGLGGLALAGAGLYVAVHHEPTPRERLVDAALAPVEALSGGVSTALTIAPYMPIIIVVGLVALVALALFLTAPALPGIAASYAKGR